MLGIHRRELMDTVGMMRTAKAVEAQAATVPVVCAVIAPTLTTLRDVASVLLNLLIRALRMFCERVGIDSAPHLLALKSDPVVAEALDDMTDADPVAVLALVATQYPGYRLTAEQIADTLITGFHEVRAELTTAN